MEFSVIVPTYMEEGCIQKCLLSIADQQYDRAKYEIIVSDARSTDRTAEIARQHSDSVLVDGRKGIAYGRNIGAKKAQGDILVFVDADVILDHDFLRHCSKEFSNPAVVGMTGVAKPSDGGALQRFVYQSTYCLVRLFKFVGLALFPGICVAYRRKEFLKIGGFREDFGIVEDLDLSRRISKEGICNLNSKAHAFVSTRRLEKHLFSTVVYHIYCDLRYLLIGKAPGVYPKVEELSSWLDLWRQKSHKKN